MWNPVKALFRKKAPKRYPLDFIEGRKTIPYPHSVEFLKEVVEHPEREHLEAFFKEHQLQLLERRSLSEREGVLYVVELYAYVRTLEGLASLLNHFARSDPVQEWEEALAKALKPFWWWKVKRALSALGR